MVRRGGARDLVRSPLRSFFPATGRGSFSDPTFCVPLSGRSRLLPLSERLELDRAGIRVVSIQSDVSP